MLVVDNLRKPFVIHLPTDVLALGLVKHEPVAVIVVANILLVKLWEWRSLILGADVLHVPFGYQRCTVGIHIWDK